MAGKYSGLKDKKKAGSSTLKGHDIATRKMSVLLTVGVTVCLLILGGLSLCMYNSLKCDQTNEVKDSRQLEEMVFAGFMRAAMSQVPQVMQRQQEQARRYMIEQERERVRIEQIRRDEIIRTQVRESYMNAAPPLRSAMYYNALQ